jgi:hypothetical protein
MLKKLILVTSIVLLSIITNAQKLSVGFQAGVKTYSMNDLKTFNQGLQTQIPFDTKVVSDFPPFFYYKPSLSIDINSLRVGAFVSFQSTGSRVSGKDYSGEYRFDMIVSSYIPGLFIEIPIFKENAWWISTNASVGYVSSTLKMHEQLTLFEEDAISDKYTFSGNNWLVELGTSLNYSLNKSVNLALNIGYSFQLGDQPFYYKEKDNTLRDIVTYNEVKPNWNGFALGLSTYFYFK